MKNISIRKAIGLSFLGISILFASSAFSLKLIIEDLYSNPITPVFIVVVICAILCFLSFVIWTFTHSLSSRYLGYLSSFFILLVYSVVVLEQNFASSLKKIEIFVVFFTATTFLALISYSSIGFPAKKKKQKELEVLDSQMLYEDNYLSKKDSYFWSINRIYSITIAIIAFPWLLIALYSSNSVKNSGNSWEIIMIFTANILAVLFWTKPKWAKIIFILLASIALVFGLGLIILSFFGKGYLKIEGVISAFGICTLFLSLILILLSKEAKRELIEFEKKKS